MKKFVVATVLLVCGLMVLIFGAVRYFKLHKEKKHKVKQYVIAIAFGALFILSSIILFALPAKYFDPTTYIGIPVGPVSSYGNALLGRVYVPLK